MEAIQILMNDHRLIEQAIDALIAYADDVARGGPERRDELSGFVRFIREFADGHHHAKEEDVLFAAMVEAGFSRQAGPVAVMLHEHDRGRAYVQALAELADRDAAWSAEDRQRLAEAAQGYGGLLAQHIQKEDRILYPMAEARLPEELLERVEADCARKESQAAQSGRLAELQSLGADLVARHPSTRPADERVSSSSP